MDRINANRGPRAVVVGGGIVGASVACYLARRGASVTLIDRRLPATGVTGDSFAWITAGQSIGKQYSQFRGLAIEEWRRLEEELHPAIQVNWRGALIWHEHDAETERFGHEQASWGHEIQLIDDRALSRLEPYLIHPPALAAFATNEGAIDPVQTTAALVRAAQSAGAELVTRSAVTAITTDDNKITGIHTDAGNIAADIVILAAGVDTPRLSKPLGIALPVEASPALLLRLQTRFALVNRIISSPELEVQQASASQLIAAEHYVDESPENGPQALGDRLLGLVKSRFSRSSGTTLERVSVGQRPIPVDGLPIVGFTREVTGLYLAVTHAGVTLAPAIGRLATHEILDEQAVACLRPYRPERFATQAMGSDSA